jgi:hypothetical protein
MSVFAQDREASRKASEAERALREAARDPESDERDLAVLAAKFAKAHDWAEDCRAEARDPREA